MRVRVTIRVRLSWLMEPERIENCLEEVVGEGEGAGRRKVVAAVEGRRKGPDSSVWRMNR